MMGSDDRLRIEVLGPIRATDEAGHDVTPDGPLQRRLLALLVLHRGRAVSADAAIDALWPDRPPRDPPAALQNHLFRLRRGLPDGVIESAGNGYRLEPTRIDLDADRLAAALGDGSPIDPGTVATIAAVLARWHGPAYPELDDVDDGRAEAGRLHELRIRAVEARAEHDLRSGPTGGLVTELTALVDDEPLRERPRSLLMSALAATGRTVEALRVYDDFRRRLGDELGIEPSPALSAQHAELLGRPDRAVSRWAPSGRLPVAVSSLIGREPLVADVTAQADAHRLVTLVGPGGVGKTRLVSEVGHRLARAEVDRPVVMVELATTGSKSAIDLVAAALTIDGRPGVPIAERVAAVLAETELVLLLDNCEHVLEPVAELVERVLAACPGVRIVTTSRERLRLAGEHVVVVPALPTPASAAPASEHDTAAVELFVARAAAVAPGFAPQPADLDVIAEIVRRLDGLPLAIELAAARLHTHDVAEVAAGLDHRFALLSSGYRTSARHGSLSATVWWSFGLLDDHLQRVFADVSVFAGSFTAADAAAVCGTDLTATSAALHQLAERSLLVRTPDRRFALLETLRAFGAEQLVATGRADEVGERHARHQVHWAEAADRRLLQESERAPIDEIDAAIPELRVALDWLLDHDEVEPAGRLVVALTDYGFLRVRPDVMAWAERVSAADPEDRSPVAPLVWSAGAYASWMAGDVTETGVRSRRALLAGERAGGPVSPVVATHCGSFALFEGRLAEAAAWYRRAADAAADDVAQRLLAASTEVIALAYAGDVRADAAATALLADVGPSVTPYAAYAWFCAGEADLALGDIGRARSRLAHALALAERTSASIVIGAAGASKASIDARLGDPVAAAEDYCRLITHWQRAGMWSTQWTMLRSIAGLLDRLGRARDAAVLEGAVRSTSAGHRIFGADAVALAELGGRLRAELGDEVYREALDEGAVLDGDAAVEHSLRALVTSAAAR